MDFDVGSVHRGKNFDPRSRKSIRSRSIFGSICFRTEQFLVVSTSGVADPIIMLCEKSEDFGETNVTSCSGIELTTSRIAGSAALLSPHVQFSWTPSSWCRIISFLMILLNHKINSDAEKRTKNHGPKPDGNKTAHATTRMRQGACIDENEAGRTQRRE